MQMQDVFNAVVKAHRNSTLKDSPQLTLGELIAKIKACGLTWGTPEEAKTVEYDFGTAIPTDLGSWRGSYVELALGYRLTGYDVNSNESGLQCKAEDLLKELESAIGKTFTGWKGGEFEMSENTPVWVDNDGNTSHTGIVDVFDDGWRIILITARCEY